MHRTSLTKLFLRIVVGLSILPQSGFSYNCTTETPTVENSEHEQYLARRVCEELRAERGNFFEMEGRWIPAEPTEAFEEVEGQVIIDVDDDLIWKTSRFVFCGVSGDFVRLYLRVVLQEELPTKGMFRGESKEPWMDMHSASVRMPWKGKVLVGSITRYTTPYFAVENKVYRIPRQQMLLTRYYGSRRRETEKVWVGPAAKNFTSEKENTGSVIATYDQYEEKVFMTIDWNAVEFSWPDDVMWMPGDDYWYRKSKPQEREHAIVPEIFDAESFHWNGILVRDGS